MVTTEDLLLPPEWVRVLPYDDATKWESWPPQAKDHTIDWDKPTNEVYHDPTTNLEFTSEFKSARQKLDYTYHRNPAKSRQKLQDVILMRVVQAAIQQQQQQLQQDNFGGEEKEQEEESKEEESKEEETKEEDEFSSHSSSPPPTIQQQQRPWIVFSAGPMGVGKGYVMSTLNERGLFPMDQLLPIDPDMIKAELPEMSGYLRVDPASAATKVHRESTQMADILLEHALQQRLPTLVDGSLRDVNYYRSLMERIRREFPEYQLAILHVTASPEIIRARAQARAQLTGRAVPSKLLEESIAQVPRSVEALSPHVDITFTISNEDGQPIQLTNATLTTKEKKKTNKGDQQEQTTTTTTTTTMSNLSWKEFREIWWSNLDATPEEQRIIKCQLAALLKPWCESKCPGLSKMKTCWMNKECIQNMKQLFIKAYPSFCPTCKLGADIQCGICIHGKNYCHCSQCGPQAGHILHSWPH